MLKIRMFKVTKPDVIQYKQYMQKDRKSKGKLLRQKTTIYSGIREKIHNMM